MKWYISTLFLILIYWGGFQEPISVRNQEIVLEFFDTKINQKNIESISTDIQEKLLKIGVSNIKIQETANGTLKISYFSIVPTETIKAALAEDIDLVSDQKSKNNQNNTPSSHYNIDIYQLTDEADLSNLDDKFIFEIKYNSDRFTNNYKYAHTRSLQIHHTNQLFKIAYKANKKSPFTKDRTSHKEPEVRAGPCIYDI
ncbi:hypothetical protein K8354_12085 [Polaribacter litorisediminis]|uniref:hypothetical protein n=1 Tax=Polaribacter litorisediminis TaxID=1908341 RepID=UPI001CBBDF5A|nr:hypothetical protein [Polaribacter litorisediminis]UAM97059.1 hypothetical protein K8354_12085 [Polaribacter litorisediminis]